MAGIQVVDHRVTHNPVPKHPLPVGGVVHPLECAYHGRQPTLYIVVLFEPPYEIYESDHLRTVLSSDEGQLPDRSL